MVTMSADTPLYYHGALSRKDCEDMLGKKNKDGAYLIRDSETIQGAMCLCVYKKKVVYTYRLLKTVHGQYTLMTAGGEEEIYFKSLAELVHHYKRRNQGLIMHLRHSVKRKTALLIQATSQFHQRPSEELLHPGPEVTQRRISGKPSVSTAYRRPSEMNLHQVKPEERPRGRSPKSHGRAEATQSRPPSQPPTDQPPTDQPSEHEEVDYENLPDYVVVQPS